MNDKSLKEEIFSDGMTANQRARLTNLKKILKNSRKVFLIHGENYDDDEAFKNYLATVEPQAQIEFMDLSGEIQFSRKDAFFPLFQNYYQLSKFWDIMIKIGISALQVFSPTIFFFHFLIEKRGFILKPERGG